ncbi:hypothetical protein HK102_009992 [Quaeritorhiza haematococci]|nr:hypothetical protein HK102_009992 [Quaeritorhiza haematococci]
MGRKAYTLVVAATHVLAAVTLGRPASGSSPPLVNLPPPLNNHGSERMEANGMGPNGIPTETVINITISPPYAHLLHRDDFSPLAIPAMFGAVLDSPQTVPVLVLETVDACRPFEVDLPNLTQSEMRVLRMQRQMQQEAGPHHMGGMAMMKRDRNQYYNDDWGYPRPGSSESEDSADENNGKRPTGENNGEDSSSSSSSMSPKTFSVMAWGSTPAQGGEEHGISVPWIAVIPRGNCAFDVKAYHTQAAGFAGMIIYNNGSIVTAQGDVPVRMAANSLGAYVDILSMFVTHMDGMELRTAAQLYTQKLMEAGAIQQQQQQQQSTRLIISMVPTRWDWYQARVPWWREGWDHKSFGHWSHLVFLLTISVLYGSMLVLLGLLFSIGRSFLIHQRIFGNGGRGPGVRGKRNEAPKLTKVTFPIRIITEQELARSGSSSDLENTGYETQRDCCAICIDEFVVGNRVRQLPCKHQFHDTCVDPWLLQHNRLCPICKRDVLESTGGKEESSSSTEVSSPTDSTSTVRERQSTNSRGEEDDHHVHPHNEDDAHEHTGLMFLSNTARQQGFSSFFGRFRGFVRVTGPASSSETRPLTVGGGGGTTRREEIVRTAAVTDSPTARHGTYV